MPALDMFKMFSLSVLLLLVGPERFIVIGVFHGSTVQ